MFIECEIDGETILIETADNAEGAKIEGRDAQVAFPTWTSFKAWLDSKKEKIQNYSSEKLTRLVQTFTKHLYNSCSNLIDLPKPKLIQIEYSIGFAITGVVFIAKSSANSGIKVTMKWEPK